MRVVLSGWSFTFHSRMPFTSDPTSWRENAWRCVRCASGLPTCGPPVAMSRLDPNSPMMSGLRVRLTSAVPEGVLVDADVVMDRLDVDVGLDGEDLRLDLGVGVRGLGGGDVGCRVLCLDPGCEVADDLAVGVDLDGLAGVGGVGVQFVADAPGQDQRVADVIGGDVGEVALVADLVEASQLR
ncbi:hypothetical protein KG112_10965 [Nocardioides sp. zg-ZUI104]|uniref:hypothetical protein n=1 Tax=Nocardioides faecalis TaxID=2803858 RepID=UPI001BCC24E3|nr:hypothetical protein [Nocardioides faecalis]MBS4753322.1 hypothetical protein [Nocardioides faecalis]